MKRDRRFLVFSDLHADNNLPMSTYDAAGVSNRLHDTIETLTQVWRLAEEQKVEAILFLGDLFNRPRPDATTVTLISRALADLQGMYAAPLVMLPGNHDAGTRRSLFTTVDFFGAVRLPNTVVIRDLDPDDPHAPLGWESEKLYFVGKRYDRPDESLARLRELFTQVGSDMGSTVLLLHHDIAGGRVGSWSPTDALPLELFKGFPLVLSGHYHQPQVIYPDGERVWPAADEELVEFGPLEPGTVVYVGSPQQHDFGDCGGARGAWVLTHSRRGKLKLDFHNLFRPTFAEASFAHTDPPAKVARMFEEAADYVKLKVVGPKHGLDSLERGAYEAAVRAAIDHDPRSFKWELQVEAHHTKRADLDSHLGIDALLDAYVNSGSVNLGDLDPADVLAYGRAMLEEVR